MFLCKLDVKPVRQYLNVNQNHGVFKTAKQQRSGFHLVFDIAFRRAIPLGLDAACPSQAGTTAAWTQSEAAFLVTLRRLPLAPSTPIENLGVPARAWPGCTRIFSFPLGGSALNGLEIRGRAFCKFC